MQDEAKRAEEAYRCRNKDEDNAFYSDILYNESFSAKKLYPQIIRKSTVQVLFSHLDNYMRKLAEQRYSNYGGIPSYESTREKGILKARKFLVRSAELNLSSVENQWQNLVKLKNIRDFIVHKESQSDKQTGIIIKICANSLNLEYDEGERDVQICSKNYCAEMIRDIRFFFSTILIELRRQKISLVSAV